MIFTIWLIIFIYFSFYNYKKTYAESLISCNSLLFQKKIKNLNLTELYETYKQKTPYEFTSDFNDKIKIFKESLSGKWLTIDNNEIRFFFLPSINKKFSSGKVNSITNSYFNKNSTIFFIGGLSYNVEKFIQYSDIFIKLRENGYNIAYIELLGQGASFVLDIIKKGKIPEKIPIEKQKNIIYKAVERIKENYQIKEKKSTFMGLSYGGLVLNLLAQDKNFNHIIKEIILLAPGIVSAHRFISPIMANYIDLQINVFQVFRKITRKKIKRKISNISLSLKNDELNLEAATSMTMGMLEVNPFKKIDLIPKDILYKIVIAQNDIIVPAQTIVNFSEEIYEHFNKSPNSSNAQLQLFIAKNTNHDIIKERQGNYSFLHNVLQNKPSTDRILNTFMISPDDIIPNRITPIDNKEFYQIVYQGTNNWLKINAP